MQSSGTSTPAGDLPWLRPGLSEKGRCTPRDSPSPPLADTISGRAIPLGPAGAHKSILLLPHNLYPSEHPPSLAGCPSPWAAGRLFPAAAPAGPPSCPSGGRVCPRGQGPACARGLRPALPDAGTGEGPSSPGAPGLQRRGSPSGPAGGAVFAPAASSPDAMPSGGRGACRHRSSRRLRHPVRRCRGAGLAATADRPDALWRAVLPLRLLRFLRRARRPGTPAAVSSRNAPGGGRTRHGIGPARGHKKGVHRTGRRTPLPSGGCGARDQNSL